MRHQPSFSHGYADTSTGLNDLTIGGMGSPNPAANQLQIDTTHHKHGDDSFSYSRQTTHTVMATHEHHYHGAPHHGYHHGSPLVTPHLPAGHGVFHSLTASPNGTTRHRKQKLYKPFNGHSQKQPQPFLQVGRNTPPKTAPQGTRGGGGGSGGGGGGGGGVGATPVGFQGPRAMWTFGAGGGRGGTAAGRTVGQVSGRLCNAHLQPLHDTSHCGLTDTLSTLTLVNGHFYHRPCSRIEIKQAFLPVDDSTYLPHTCTPIHPQSHPSAPGAPGAPGKPGTTFFDLINQSDSLAHNRTRQMGDGQTLKLPPLFGEK